jgi:short-subunit dehydrogenase
LIIAYSRILITGAAGGIGRELALALARKGASLVLLDRDAVGLESLVSEMTMKGADVRPIIADLSDSSVISAVLDEAMGCFDGLDILINNAGILDFSLYEDLSVSRVQLTMQINTIAPMLLSHAVLPIFKSQAKGMIVNIGSTFGSIGFAHYAPYSASKFAMRGFSQALRRELVDTGVTVLYVAPRATTTTINNDASVDLMKKQGTHMDSPALVANKVIDAIEQERHETYIGQPESFFARLNALIPQLVDMGLKAKTLEARALFKK